MDMQLRRDSTITAVLGPTNTGKTHYAIERMLARKSGVIGLPLRLLAREIYDRIAALRGADAVSLITGEEKIAPASARYHVCTVEAMPLAVDAEFVAVDEIQLCADPDRGHVFTDRLLHARGRYETLLLGSDTIRPRIASLVPEAGFTRRERFSTLSYAGERKISRLRPRTAVVAFSVDQVYAIAELIRRQRGGAAVVMGALSPRTRNAQVALYQEGEVDYLVATDAIGMGLNMDVDHVAFAGTSKFDGWRHRRLEPNELSQIAGRAGRYTKDGTFGVTGEAGALDPETVESIENHRFKPLTRVMWRNTDLVFGSVPALIASLEKSPDKQDLVRAREAEDMVVLRTLWEEPEVRKIANTGQRIRLLWEVCQIPDFRKTSPGEHATLLGHIYGFLHEGREVIPADWLAGQIRRLDRTDGDIDTLSKRLAFIRTWTYVANRQRWVEDADSWRNQTRLIEDKLSDALHERLTQRFVDRRTSVLMRRLKQKERLVAEVNDNGEVMAEGQFLGRLDGFRFTIDETASGDELKTLRSASMAALQGELSRRADKLYLSPDGEIDVTDQGGLMWGKDAVGRLEKGDQAFAPKVTVFVDDHAGPDVAEKVERRLSHWLTRRIGALFEPLTALRDDEAITGLARGVAFRIVESFGIIARREISDDIKALAQEDRALLRKHGVRFGQHFIFMPALLKPAPTRMRLLLWALWDGLEEFPDAPPPGHVTVPADRPMPRGYWEMAGYRRAGQRAVRIDMLERLADLIRPMDARAGFEATPDMLSITGCTLEQFADLMQGLGFHAERGERPKTARPPSTTAGEAPETVEKAEAENAPVADGAEGAPAQEEQTPDTAAGEEIQEASSADAPVEASADVKAETEAVLQSAAPPAAPPQEVTNAAETVPEEEGQPEPAKDGSEETSETEVFFMFTQRRQQRGPRKPRQDDGPETSERRARPARGPKGKSGKQAKGQKGGKGPKQDDQEKKRSRSSPPRREERPPDPDSPFAILQQLKNR